MSMTRTKGGKRLVSEINVTPLVDVMLVLLIIFMITAPMMTQGIDLDLHEATGAPQEQKEKPLVISVSQAGQRITLNDKEMNRDQIRQELAGMSAEDKENKMLFIEAKGDVPYGLVATLFADARDAGLRKLSPAIIR